MRGPLLILALTLPLLRPCAQPPDPVAEIDAAYEAHLERRAAATRDPRRQEEIQRERLRVRPDHRPALEALAAVWQNAEPHLAYAARRQAGALSDPSAAEAEWRERARQERDAPGRDRHRVAMEAVLEGVRAELARADLAAAEARLREGLRVHPVDPLLLREAGSLFAASGEWSLCAMIYGFAAAVHPDDREFAIRHALALARTGRETEALDRLRAQLDAEPGSSFLLENAGRLALRLDQDELAASLLARLAQAEPENATHWRLYGETLLRGGPERLLSAKIAFLKVLELEPQDRAAPFYLAAVEARRGNVRECASRLIELAPRLGRAELERVLGEEPFRAHVGLRSILQRLPAETPP